MPDEKKVKLKYPMPKTHGAAIDLLFKVRTARKVIQAKAEAEKEQENEIERIIMEKFGKSELEGARGKLAQCSIKRSDVPTFEDWDRFSKHLEKHPEDVTLLQRRLSIEACRERWAAKQTIPGVGVYTRVSLNLTKVKK
jgi:hypothetical protein